MSQSPDIQKLEQTLRSSVTVAGGFLGTDERPLNQIIAADRATLEALGFTQEQIGQRMQDLTDTARPRLGTEVVIDDRLVVWCEEWKGLMSCPWPHGGRFDKRLTTVRRTDTGQTICWTDLNIHLIAGHGFFEGQGAAFRLEPQELIRILF
jgi:hypothetical protein